MDPDGPFGPNQKDDRCSLALALPTESSTSPKALGKDTGNMDLNTSEVSSLVSAPLQNKTYQSDSMDFQLSGSGGVMHSQSSQARLNQVELSQSTKGESSKHSRGRRPTLTPAQKKEHKRLSDRQYREKKKYEMRFLRELEEENSRLKLEYESLKHHIGFLKENIRLLQSSQLAQAQDILRSDSNFSLATSQPQDHRSVSFQEKHGKDSRAADWLSDVQMNHGLQTSEKSISEGVSKNENLTENEENSPSGMSYVSTQMNELLTKIEADESSNVGFSDFTDLDGERSRVGRYNIPSSLIPTVQRIMEAYGDITATSKLSLMIIESVYILFCATVKEMDDLQLEQVTESKILKWRDTIKDALHIGFNVEFAKEHLKKITGGYIGLKCKQELERIRESISKLEAKLNGKREELAKLWEEYRPFMHSAEEFGSKPVSSGILS